MPKKYKYTKKTGRPTKYSPNVNYELDKYLKTTSKKRMSLPTVQGFALWLDVDSDTLNNWAKKYKEFFGTLERLKLLQMIQLIDDGIYGGKGVNTTIVKLLLQNNHGMKERTDTTTNNKELPIQVVSYNKK